AIEFVKTFDDDRRLSCIHALAYMRYANAAEAHAAISVVFPFIAPEAGDNVRLNALLGAFDILKAYPDAAIAATLVQAAVADAGPLTLHGIVQVVWLHEKRLDDATLALALQTVQAVSPENRGTIDI